MAATHLDLVLTTYGDIKINDVNSSAQVIPAMAMVRYVTPPSGAFQLNTYTPANQTKLQFYWSDTSNWEQLMSVFDQVLISLCTRVSYMRLLSNLYFKLTLSGL